MQKTQNGRKVYGKKLCPAFRWPDYRAPTSPWCNKFTDTNPQILQMTALNCVSAPTTLPLY